MGWLSDTWREVTSGGKARTATYNRPRREPARQERAEPVRRSSSSTTRRSSPAPAQAPQRRQGTTGTQRPSSGGGGGGGGRVSAVRAAVPLPAETQPAPPTWRGVANPEQYGRREEPGERPPAPGARYTPTIERDRANADPTEIRPSQRLTVPAVKAVVAQSDAPEAAGGKPAPWSGRDVIAARDAERGYSTGARATVRELTDEEYLALTPRQKAAVQYNTGLVSAAQQDREEGATGSTAVAAGFLSDLGQTPGELDAFLRLDRAIGDHILQRMEWAPENQDDRVDAAQQTVVAAAPAIQSRLSQGYTGLRGDTMRPGTTDSPRDQVLQMAWNFMVDSGVEQTPEDISIGLGQLNANMGTDIAPEELWDFARMQLEAVDVGRLANTDVTVPVTDATIVPLSVADIRARYGL
jgi:hypothetical protein